MDEWERLERRWKIISRIVVGLICTAIFHVRGAAFGHEGAGSVHAHLRAGDP